MRIGIDTNRTINLVALSISLFLAPSANAEIPDHPTMITPPTGSRLATWTLPGAGEVRKTPVVYLHGGPGGFITTGVIEKGAIQPDTCGAIYAGPRH